MWPQSLLLTGPPTTGYVFIASVEMLRLCACVCVCVCAQHETFVHFCKRNCYFYFSLDGFYINWGPSNSLVPVVQACAKLALQFCVYEHGSGNSNSSRGNSPYHHFRFFLGNLCCMQGSPENKDFKIQTWQKL